jgi:hypothetical protein
MCFMHLVLSWGERHLLHLSLLRVTTSHPTLSNDDDMPCDIHEEACQQPYGGDTTFTKVFWK